MRTCRLIVPSRFLKSQYRSGDLVLANDTAILHPPPDRCVIDIETALLQQLLNIAQRQRIEKIPPDRTKYEAGLSLPPFEDRGSGYHFPILSRHQPAARKLQHIPMLQAWQFMSTDYSKRLLFVKRKILLGRFALSVVCVVV